MTTPENPFDVVKLRAAAKKIVDDANPCMMVTGYRLTTERSDRGKIEVGEWNPLIYEDGLLEGETMYPIEMWLGAIAFTNNRPTSREEVLMLSDLVRVEFAESMGHDNA